MNPLVRWMIRRDTPEVLAIEADAVEPWSEDDLLTVLRQRNCIGQVIDDGVHVLGFMVYTLLPRRIHVLRLGIDPRHRRRRLGTQLVTYLQDKVSRSNRRDCLTCAVPEDNLPLQLFFRACGWRADVVRREAIERTDGSRLDAYRFRWDVPPPPLTRKRTVREYGCTLCQLWHCEDEPVFQTHLMYQSRHGIRHRIICE